MRAVPPRETGSLCLHKIFIPLIEIGQCLPISFQFRFQDFCILFQSEKYFYRQYLAFEKYCDVGTHIVFSVWQPETKERREVHILGPAETIAP